MKTSLVRYFRNLVPWVQKHAKRIHGHLIAFKPVKRYFAITLLFILKFLLHGTANGFTLALSEKE